MTQYIAIIYALTRTILYMNINDLLLAAIVFIPIASNNLLHIVISQVLKKYTPEDKKKDAPLFLVIIINGVTIISSLIMVVLLFTVDGTCTYHFILTFLSITEMATAVSGRFKEACAVKTVLHGTFFIISIIYMPIYMWIIEALGLIAWFRNYIMIYRAERRKKLSKK